MKKPKPQGEDTHQLISQYKEMFEDGYETQNRGKITSVYNTCEITKVAPYIRRIFEACDVNSVLDYGCGATDWQADHAIGEESLKNYFHLSKCFHYEPARDIDERKQVDCVVSFDVLEHIPLQEVAPFLEKMASYAQSLVVINIACYAASALLPNSENAHVTVRSPQWWMGVLETISSKFPSVTFLLLTSRRYGEFEGFLPWRHAQRSSKVKFVIPQQKFAPIDQLFGTLPLLEARRTYLAGDFEECVFWLTMIHRPKLTQQQFQALDSIALAITATQPLRSQVVERLTRDIDKRFRPDLWHRTYLKQENETEAHKYKSDIQKKITLEPDILSDMTYIHGTYLLHQADYERGLELYRFRSDAKNYASSLIGNAAHVPAAVELCDVVVVEQGIGDIILHLAYLYALRSPEEFTLIAWPRWHSLIRHLWPDAKVTDRLGENVERANLSGDYLEVYWRQMGKLAPPLLPQARTQGTKAGDIGIVWRGGYDFNRSKDRRISLDTFVEKLDKEASYVCLQHDVTNEEKHYLRSVLDVKISADIRQGGEILKLHEVISGLSSFVSVDSAVVHFSGLAGVPGLGYMGEKPHWYWGLEKQFSHLYPTVKTQYV